MADDFTVLKQCTQCADFQCYKVYNRQTCELKPGQINYVNPKIKFNIAPGYIIKRIPHYNDEKDWKIVGSIFDPDLETKEVTFPIITLWTQTLPEGMVLCHIQYVSITNIFYQLMGKSKQSKAKNKDYNS